MNANQMKSASAPKSQSIQIRAGLVLLAAVCVSLAAMLMIQQVGAMQMMEQSDSIRTSPSATVAVVENPEITVRVLENLLRSILYSSADLQPLTK